MKLGKLLRITTVSMSFRLLLKGQMNFMSQYFETHACSSPGWELDALEVEEATKTHPIEMERVPSPFKDLVSLRKLIALIRQLKPEIVHTHTPKAGLLGMMAARLAGVPIRLHTVAGIPWMESQGAKRKLLSFIEKLTYSCATHVYSNSFALKDFILENRLLSETKLDVLANGSSNGIDTSWYSRSPEVMGEAKRLQKEWAIEEGEHTIVFVGRLVKDKGIEELLEAYKNLKQQYKVTLILVGPYEKERDPLARWAEELIETDANIISTGYIKDVRPYLAASSILAFPSYREGFPNVPMQAGAMGLPSVVTNINGCNEIIEAGENGLLVPPKDAGALEAALATLMQDKVLYAKLSTRARPMICDRFEQVVVWEALLNEYKKHLAKQ
jgi:glycosyltransferase involved in cell wall biosynthesis